MSTFTYPGVYIQELPSGVHSISGVATSIAAFVGWAPQGPVKETKLIESWSDYQATYGGLDARSLLGYSVNQFFGNGGQQAYIVRLIWDGSIPADGRHQSQHCGHRCRRWGWLRHGPDHGIAGRNRRAGGQGAHRHAPAAEHHHHNRPGCHHLPLGGTITFVAHGNFSDSTQSVVAGATWTSSNSSVVSITTAGVATAAGAGSAVLTVTSGSIASTLAVTRDPRPDSIRPLRSSLPPGNAHAGRRRNACTSTTADRPQPNN